MFNIGISRNSSLMLVCTGVPIYSDFVALVNLAVDVCRRESFHRVLIDMSSIPPTFCAEDREKLGRFAGAKLQGKQVALVVPSPERLEGARAAASASGGTLQYFTSYHSAVEWLESPRS